MVNLDNEAIKIRKILDNVIKKSSAKHVAFSGGLDSSIITSHLPGPEKNGLAVICDDFIANDLTYAQISAKYLGLSLKILHVNTERLLDVIENTISILENFNDIEIRNSIVMYLALDELKKSGVKTVLTGDGADELFAGYNFLINKSEDELENELTRIRKIMHYTSNKIAEFLGIKIEQPFLNNEVIEYAENIPVSLKVNEKNGKRYGKWILRMAYENNLHNSIVWREKSAMQDGSGTSGLTKFFDSIITDNIFNDKIALIKKNDNVRLRSKESLHYYEIFRKEFKIKPENGHSCNDCGNKLAEDAKFCRMCGKFPI